eukprot:4654134-Pleurochrysis_carterae.AAC.1
MDAIAQRKEESLEFKGARNTPTSNNRNRTRTRVAHALTRSFTQNYTDAQLRTHRTRRCAKPAQP